MIIWKFVKDLTIYKVLIHVLFTAQLTECYFQPTDVNVSETGLLMVEDGSRPMCPEKIEVSWLSLSYDVQFPISHYIVRWLSTSMTGLEYSSEPIVHIGNGVIHAYDTTDYTHGECYNFSVIAVDVNGDNASTNSYQFQTIIPAPYNATFEPIDDGTQAKITWWMVVNFTVSSYEIELTGSSGARSYIYIADSSSPTEYTVPLYSGLYHPILIIRLRTSTACEANPQYYQLQKDIIYSSSPPTPTNVELSVSSNSDPNLIVKWSVPHSFDLFEYHIFFVSNTATFVCTTIIREEILNSSTLTFDASSPDCVLNSSTSYQASVQIQSLNNQFTERGNMSLPSNFQVTVPAVANITESREIFYESGVGTARLRIKWLKPDGGDFIDEFLIESSSDDFLETVYVPFAQGKAIYEHNTTNLLHGTSAYIVVYTINLAGNSSTNPRRVELAPPVPFNVQIRKPLIGDNTTEFVVSWEMPERYNVTNYEILYEEARGESNINQELVQGLNLSATLSASCGGQTIRARVRAISATGYGMSSEQTSWYQTEFPIPTNVTLSPSGAQALDVDWESDACTADYEIQLIALKSIDSRKYKYFPSNFPPVTFDNLPPGDMYQATVRAFNSYGDGTPSMLSNFKQTEPHPVFDLSINLDQVNPSEILSLQWKTLGYGDNVTIIAENRQFMINISKVVPFNQTFAQIQVYPGFNYSITVYVSSYNLISNLTFGSIITAPPVPYNVNITKPLFGNKTTDFVVSWEMPEQYYVTYFIVFYEEERTQYDAIQATVDGSSLNATLSTSCGGQTVRAWVQAHNDQFMSISSLNSPWYQTEFPVPTNATLMHNGTETLTANWVSEACTVDYEIEFVSATGGSWKKHTYFPRNNPPITFDNFIPGDMYQATVRAFNSYGEGVPSIPSTLVQTEPHHVVNVSIHLSELNPSEIVDLSWDTIGVGDNITIEAINYPMMNLSIFVINFENKSYEFHSLPGNNYTFFIYVNSYFIQSSRLFGIITTKPQSPVYNVTVASMTSLVLNWLPPAGNFDYFIIELKSLNSISIVFPIGFPDPYLIKDLTPYTEYLVAMYSAVINHNGEEERSLPSSQYVFTFVEQFCDEAQLPHPNDQVLVTFSRTQAGYSNSTVEICSSENRVPYGTRSCSIDAEWEKPIWLSSCEKTFEDLAEEEIKDDTKREEVASDLTVLTSNSSSLSSDSIQQSTKALESIVETEELEQNTTTLVIESIGNLLAAPEEELQSSEVQDSLLSTLDEVATKVVLDEGEEYHSTTSTLSLAVVETTGKTANLVSLQENFNPSTGNVGFSEGQFQTFFTNFTTTNSSSIYIPLNDTSNKNDRRVSFYAFADNTLFQSSKLIDTDVTAREVTVESKIILSASLQSFSQQLQENVTIVLEYTTSNSTSKEDGEYICGFWNEQYSVWSQSGCTLTSMTEKFIECQCNHLTNFATLFAYSSSISIISSQTLATFTYVCCSLSLLGSILTIICLAIVWSSKNFVISKQNSFILMNLAVSLTLLNGFLLISNLKAVTENETSCTAMAVILHFSLFSTLLWTTVEAAYVCVGIVAPIYHRTRLTSRKVFIPSSTLGWLVPFIFVGFSAGLNISWYQAQKNSTNTCWIIVDKVLYLVIAPASIILATNTAIYILVVVSYLKRRRVGVSTNKSNSTASKSIWFSLSLFLMFGISWVFGFLLFGSSTFNEVFAYIFTITTALQGMFIFLLFVARNQRIRQVMRKKMSSIQSDFTKFASSSA